MPLAVSHVTAAVEFFYVCCDLSMCCVQGKAREHRQVCMVVELELKGSPSSCVC